MTVCPAPNWDAGTLLIGVFHASVIYVHAIRIVRWQSPLYGSGVVPRSLVLIHSSYHLREAVPCAG